MLTFAHPLPTQAAQVNTQHPPSPSQYDLLNFLKPPRFWPSAMAVLGGGCRDREGQVYKLEACPCLLLPSCPLRLSLCSLNHSALPPRCCHLLAWQPLSPVLLSPVVPAVPSWLRRSHQWDYALGLPHDRRVPAVERDGSSMDGGLTCTYGAQPHGGAPGPHCTVCCGSCVAWGNISMRDAVAQTWCQSQGLVPRSHLRVPARPWHFLHAPCFWKPAAPDEPFCTQTDRAGGCGCPHLLWRVLHWGRGWGSPPAHCGDTLLRGPCSEMSHDEGTRAAALSAKGLSGVTTWRPTAAYKSRQAARRRAGSSVAGGRK